MGKYTDEGQPPETAEAPDSRDSFEVVANRFPRPEMRHSAKKLGLDVADQAFDHALAELAERRRADGGDVDK